MPDFKGRKDFPEVADNKIKIGDYSGMNRLSVVDIYSPKEEPELRDQIMEPVKGASNNYDSPILSQQPVIVLSDDASEEAFLINAIDGYVAKQGGGVEKATPKIRHKRQMKEWEKEPIQDRGGAPPPSKPRKPKFTPYEKADTTPTSEDAPLSGTDPRPTKRQFSDQEPPEPKPDYGRKLKRRYEKADTIEKKGRKKADTAFHPDTPPGIIQGGSKHVGEGLHLRGQKDAKKLASPVISIKPGDEGHAEMRQEMKEQAAQNKQQGHTQNRPLVDPLDKAHVKGIGKQWEAEEHEQEPGENIDIARKRGRRGKLPKAATRLPTTDESFGEFTRDIRRGEHADAQPESDEHDESMLNAAGTDDRTNIGAGYQSRMKEAVDSETGERFLLPPSIPQSDVDTRKIRKSDDLEEGSRSWSYQG